jgi:hypothetical protein
MKPDDLWMVERTGYFAGVRLVLSLLFLDKAGEPVLRHTLLLLQRRCNARASTERHHFSGEERAGTLDFF